MHISPIVFGRLSFTPYSTLLSLYFFILIHAKFIYQELPCQNRKYKTTGIRVCAKERGISIERKMSITI